MIVRSQEQDHFNSAAVLGPGAPESIQALNHYFRDYGGNVVRFSLKYK